MEDILRQDLEEIDLRRHAGEIAEKAIAQAPPRRGITCSPRSRRLVLITAVLAPGVSDSGRYPGPGYSSLSAKLAAGPWRPV
jgi:hypothetical protein